MRLKEEAKHHCLTELAQIRQLLLSIDRKCQLHGRVFQLQIAEVVALADNEGRDQLTALAQRRFEASIAWKGLQLPASLCLRDLERIDMLTGTRTDNTEQSELVGKRVAGEHEVIGRVRVITDIAQIETFEAGEILIARMTDPTWYPLFAQARGIVTEVSGWLSHAAIVAREYDLPAIVGVPGICNSLNTGDVIRMHLSGAVELLDERRREGPLLRDVNVEETLQSSSSTVPAQIEVKHGSSPYQLSENRLFRFRRSIERRALKDQLSDRRSMLRVNAAGDVQRDRRLANRLANAEHIKKAS